MNGHSSAALRNYDMANLIDPKPGFFGKVPNQGDFVSRRLPRLFIDPWDRWLQQGLEHSRAQLGQHWLDDYLTCPIWRFVLSPNICGDQPWGGLMMPSVDRVGRYFPLTLALPLSPQSNWVTLALDEADWFDQAETLLLSALEENFSLDLFDRQLQSLGSLLPLLDKPANPMAGTKQPGKLAWHFKLPEQDPLSLYPSMTKHLLDALLSRHSLWWTPGSEQIEPAMLLSEGLPQPQSFTAMLNGQWEQAGWEEREVFFYPENGSTSSAAPLQH